MMCMYFKQCILIYETIFAVAKDLIELKSIGMFWNWNSGILQLPKNKDKTMDDFKTAQFNTAHHFSREKKTFSHTNDVEWDGFFYLLIFRIIE